ncbi:MAG: hypothetical protein ACLP59_32575 [Bryobacteraceae bacterium]
MKNHLRTLTPVIVSLFFVAAGTQRLNAQIVNGIRARLDHSFVIGNTTLPPGEYNFRMVDNTELSMMTVTSENDKVTVEFIVRDATDDHRPNHSELLFRKYGNTEFLSKLFEAGSRNGVEITETSRQEARFAKHAEHATEHIEEQK